MGRKVNYFEAQRAYISDDTTILANVPISAIPSTLSAIESRKGRSFWLDDDTFSDAYQGLCRMQWELLMDAKEDLIVEIRGTRGPGPFDTTTYPVGTFPGRNLDDILGALGGPFANLDVQLTVIRGLSEEMRDLLTQIRDQGGTASEGQLDALLQIVALLSV